MDEPQTETLAAVNGTPLPVSRRVPTRCTAPSGATYALRAPTDPELADIYVRVLQDHGQPVTTEEVRQAIREGAAACLSEQEAAVLGTALDEFGLLEQIADRDEEQAAQLAEVREAITVTQRQLSRSYAPLRKLQAAILFQNQAWDRWRVRAAVQSWEGLAAPCRRRDGYLTDEAFRAIPRGDYAALVEATRALAELTADREPDSASQ